RIRRLQAWGARFVACGSSAWASPVVSRHFRQGRSEMVSPRVEQLQVWGVRLVACSLSPWASMMTSADDQTGSVPVHLVYEEDLERWISAQSAGAQRWIEAHAVKAERNKLLVLPGPEGAPEAAALGMGRREGNGSLDCWCAAGLPGRLPGGRYRLAAGPSQHDALTFAFGWAYGQYKFERYRRGAAQRAAELLTPPGVDPAEVE